MPSLRWVQALMGLGVAGAMTVCSLPPELPFTAPVDEPPPPSCGITVGNLPAPLLFWQTPEQYGFRVVDVDGTLGPLLDVGTQATPLAFYPERDLIAAWISTGLKIMHATPGRAAQYLTLDDHQYASGVGTPQGSRIVTLHSSTSDAGPGDSVVVIWDVDGEGAVTQRQRVNLGPLDVSSSWPVALDEERVVFATAYWSPTGTEGARRLLRVDLSSGTTQELYRPAETDDFISWMVQRDANVIFVSTRPHTQGPDITGAITEALSLETGTPLGRVDGILVGYALNGTYGGSQVLRGEEPAVVLHADGTLRSWRPWRGQEPSSPWALSLVPFLGAVGLSGAFAVVSRSGNREAWISVVGVDDQSVVMEHHEALPPRREHEGDARMQLIPEHISASGTSVLFSTILGQDDSFAFTGETLVTLDGCRWPLYGSATAATGRDPPNSDGGSALYFVADDGRPRKVPNFTPETTGMVRGRGWFGFY
ncbi:MAG: hypothetical protein AB2A00_37860 [Myxococcota bacterium]